MKDFKVGEECLVVFGTNYKYVLEKEIEPNKKYHGKLINIGAYSDWARFEINGARLSYHLEHGLDKYCDFKLYKEKEEMKFDMKTQPWYIRVNNEKEYYLIEEWLKENYGKGLGLPYRDYIGYFTNTWDSCEVAQEILYMSQQVPCNCKEIKLKFKTVIDSVEWPDVESEEDKKVRELQETIKLAQQQIEELQRMKK